MLFSFFPELQVSIATTTKEYQQQRREIEATYEACCPGWMAYDSAMFLDEQGIKLPCEEHNTKKRFQGLDVEAAVKDAITYVEKGSKFHRDGRLHDAIIFWLIAFHLTIIIDEADLHFKIATILVGGQYALFRVIISQRNVLQVQSRKELSQFDPIIHKNERPIKMPPPPKDATSTSNEAMQAVLSCDIVRPNVRKECVIGQTFAQKVFERNLENPYKQPEAVSKDKIKRGVLLYGPPGNGKVAQCINHCLSKKVHAITFISNYAIGYVY